MTLKSFTLGKSVAIVAFVIETNFDLATLTEHIDVDRYHYVKEMYHELMASDVKFQLDIPATSCSPREPMLDDNDRFFVCHTLIGRYQNKTTRDRLIKHLNNCYSCFQIYSQFYKEFYQADQEIRQKVGA